MIFTFWEGPRSPLIEACLDSLVRFNPSAQILEPGDIPPDIWELTEGLNTCFRSDLVRLWGLRQWGGIWVDADFLHLDTLAPEEELAMSKDLWGVYNPHLNGTKNWGATGILGAPLGGRKESPILTRMEQACRDLLTKQKAGERIPYGSTSVGLAARHFKDAQDRGLDVMRQQHWRLHPVPWFKCREIFTAKGHRDIHEASGPYNPNAACYHLGNVVTDLYKDRSLESLLDGTSFLSFLLQKSLGRPPAIFGRTVEILRRLPAEDPRMAEVGVWQGRNARNLLQQRKDLHMTLVDTWSPDHLEGYKGTGDFQAKLGQGKWDRVLANLRKDLRWAPGRWKTLRGPSHEMVHHVEDRSLDMVFLDGDHSAEGVTLDLDNWEQKIKDGGWIGSHDYGHPREGRGYGVKAAVDAWASRQGFPVETGLDYTCFMRISR